MRSQLRIAGSIVVNHRGRDVEIPIRERHRDMFEARHGRGSVKRLYRILAESCDSMRSTAADFGITVERVRQIYLKYLSPYLEAKTGRERMVSCSAAKRWAGVKYSKPVRRIWRDARAAGLTVYPVGWERGRQGLYVSKDRLFINGNLCVIRHSSHHRSLRLQSPNQSSYATYCFFSVSEECLDCDFFIFVAANLVYVIPTSILRELRSVNRFKGIRRKQPSKTFYLPVRDGNRVWSKGGVGVNWRSYRNAWHLFGGGLDMTALSFYKETHNEESKSDGILRSGALARVQG